MDVVTGAFGYTGRFITRRLLQAASVVRTLTDHPDRPNPFGERVEVARLAFDDRPALVASLRGVDVLYNTYWIRFARGDVTLTGLFGTPTTSSIQRLKPAPAGSCISASPTPRRRRFRTSPGRRAPSSW